MRLGSGFQRHRQCVSPSFADTRCTTDIWARRPVFVLTTTQLQAVANCLWTACCPRSALAFDHLPAWSPTILEEILLPTACLLCASPEEQIQGESWLLRRLQWHREMDWWHLPFPIRTFQVTPRRSRLETFPETAPEGTQASSLSQPEGVDMAVKQTWLYLILS